MKSFLVIFQLFVCLSISAQNQCPEWTISDWGECSVECGAGIQTRTVQCYCDGILVADGECDQENKPSTTQECNIITFEWFAGDFGVCEITCGMGSQSRIVECRDCEGNQALDGNCSGSKPSSSQSCNPFTYVWVEGSWSDCDTECGEGQRTRTVSCESSSGEIVDACNCEGEAPATSEPCLSLMFEWFAGNFGVCEITCGVGSQSRIVECRDCEGNQAQDGNCTGSKPSTSRSCEPSVTYGWQIGAFGECEGDCGAGVKIRTVECLNSLNEVVDDCNCLEDKPNISTSCFIPGCGIGIGVESPLADLHLNGSLRINNGQEGIGKVLTSDANGNATWQELPTPNLIDVTGDDRLLEFLPEEAVVTISGDNGLVKKYANSSTLLLYLLKKMDEQEAEIGKQKLEISKLKKENR